MFDPEAFERAANSYDRLALEAQVAELVKAPAATSVDALEGILATLQKKRQYELLVQVADAFVAAGPTSAQVMRRYAQSLIEQHNLTGAMALLEEMLAAAPEGEKGEAHGLIGRVHKQTYVDAAKASPAVRRLSLEKALRIYYEFYQRSPAQYWHGINAVALAARAERDGVQVSVKVDVRGLALQILATIDNLPAEQRKHWEHATEGEAYLALGKPDSALLSFAKVVESAGADAFEIGAPLRQLQEVWQLEDSSPIIALLRAALIDRQGSRIEMRPGELESLQRVALANKETLERVLGKAAPKSLALFNKWNETALARASCVARIENRAGTGLGTGFIVPAAVFFPQVPALAGEYVLLTNAHVLDDFDPEALRLDEARVRFELLPGQANTLKIREELWRSAAPELDTVIARLESALTGVEDYPLASRAEPRFNQAAPNCFYVIGYPGGKELSFSFEDNLQVGWKRPRLHYRTPTEGGNSGSPVFDHDWQLVAIHRAATKKRLDGADGDYLANEGIWIHEIIAETTKVELKVERATPAAPAGPATTSV